MSGASTRVGVVRCPICLDQFVWPEDDVIWLLNEETSYTLVDISDVVDPLKRATIKQDGYQRCPNPSGDADEHYLPATYHSHARPLVVGLVGTPASGKTHLLTAMIREAVEQRGLQHLGLTVDPLDGRKHDAFRKTHIQPFEDGVELPGTRDGISMFADILLVKGPALSRPVTFFDVSGEDLQSVGATGWRARFLAGAGALLFVHGLSDAPDGGASSNRAFSQVLTKLRAVVPNLRQLPAAIVVTKADRMRYLSPIDRWWPDETIDRLDVHHVHAESRDVYALLYRQRAMAVLEPFNEFDRCTLHLVSASGCEAVGAQDSAKRFVRGVSPRRVLQPLVAILAMAGLVPGPDAAEVGR